jgi:hypothetical protein
MSKDLHDLLLEDAAQWRTQLPKTPDSRSMFARASLQRHTTHIARWVSVAAAVALVAALAMVASRLGSDNQRNGTTAVKPAPSPAETMFINLPTTRSVLIDNISIEHPAAWGFFGPGDRAAGSTTVIATLSASTYSHCIVIDTESGGRCGPPTIGPDGVYITISLGLDHPPVPTKVEQRIDGWPATIQPLAYAGSCPQGAVGALSAKLYMGETQEGLTNRVLVFVACYGGPGDAPIINDIHAMINSLTGE